jgi:hypothetical protein
VLRANPLLLARIPAGISSQAVRHTVSCARHPWREKWTSNEQDQPVDRGSAGGRRDGIDDFRVEQRGLVVSQLAVDLAALVFSGDRSKIPRASGFPVPVLSAKFHLTRVNECGIIPSSKLALGNQLPAASITSSFSAT